MDKVQASLNEYFSSKGFFKGLMELDFLLYGGGLLLLLIGNVFSFIGTSVISTLGLIAFWAGIVFAFAKKDEIGLTIAFGCYALIFFADFIISLIYVFNPYYGAAGIPGLFSILLHIGLAVGFGLCVMKKSGYYAKYREKKQAQAEAYTAQQAQAAAYAAQQQSYASAPPALSACAACGAPIGGGALFCPKCGAKQEKPEKKLCGSCGAEINEGAAFCVKCGAKIE